MQQRLRSSLQASNLSATEFVGALLPSMFSADAPPDRVAAFGANMAESDPEGFRVMATALAQADLRDVLPQIDVPTLPAM